MNADTPETHGTSTAGASTPENRGGRSTPPAALATWATRLRDLAERPFEGDLAGAITRQPRPPAGDPTLISMLTIRVCEAEGVPPPAWVRPAPDGRGPARDDLAVWACLITGDHGRIPVGLIDDPRVELTELTESNRSTPNRSTPNRSTPNRSTPDEAMRDMAIAPGAGDPEPAPITREDPDEAIEVWSERELAALHAVFALARARPDSGAGSALLARVESAVAWHVENLQPDNATNHPWAVHVFLHAAQPRDGVGDDRGDAAVAMHAQTILHNYAVLQSHAEDVSKAAPGGDIYSSLIMLDAANSLHDALKV